MLVKWTQTPPQIKYSKLPASHQTSLGRLHCQLSSSSSAVQTVLVWLPQKSENANCRGTLSRTLYHSELHLVHLGWTIDSRRAGPFGYKDFIPSVLSNRPLAQRQTPYGKSLIRRIDTFLCQPSTGSLALQLTKYLVGARCNADRTSLNPKNGTDLLYSISRIGFHFRCYMNAQSEVHRCVS